MELQDLLNHWWTHEDAQGGAADQRVFDRLWAANLLSIREKSVLLPTTAFNSEALFFEGFTGTPRRSVPPVLHLMVHCPWFFGYCSSEKMTYTKAFRIRCKNALTVTNFQLSPGEEYFFLFFSVITGGNDLFRKQLFGRFAKPI